MNSSRGMGGSGNGVGSKTDYLKYAPVGLIVVVLVVLLLVTFWESAIQISKKKATVAEPVPTSSVLIFHPKVKYALWGSIAALVVSIGLSVKDLNLM